MVVDAYSAFNHLNRAVAIKNIQYSCPLVVHIIVVNFLHIFPFVCHLWGGTIPSGRYHTDAHCS